MRQKFVVLCAVILGSVAADAKSWNSGFKLQADYSIDYGWKKNADWQTWSEEKPEDEYSSPPPQDISDKTIYDTLKGDPKFSLILRAINFDNATVDLLKDTSANITFFVPPNSALPKRPRRKEEWEPEDLSLSSIVHDTEAPTKDQIRQLVHALLSYHILPQGLNSRQLGTNSTFATLLKAGDGSFGGQSRRVSVFPPIFGRGGIVNLYAKIRTGIETTNGYIYVIDHPLIPPFSVLEKSFLLQDAFSIWTSSLQKVNLTDAAAFTVLPGGFGIENKTTAPAVTAFIPTNSAWRRLPKGLQLYLFSPFGTRALKKLLQFHIVPDYVYHADWSYNATASDARHVVESTDISGASVDAVNAESHCRKELVHQIASFESKNGRRLRGAFSERSRAIKRAFADMKDDPDFPDIPDIPNFPDIPDIPDHPRPKPPKKPTPPKRPQPPRRPSPPRRPPHAPKPAPPSKAKVLLNSTIELPTLLANHTLTVHVLRVEGKLLPPSLTTSVTANGVPVALADGVARNGAIHVVTRLLDPRGPRKRPGHRHPSSPSSGEHQVVFDDSIFEDENEDHWADWLDWLPQWAQED